jgi:hypothetical protein
MLPRRYLHRARALLLLAAIPPSALCFDGPAAHTISAPLPLIDRNIRADIAFLADDDLHGRGSATRDEHIAASFAAAQFQTLGLDPGGDNGTYLQKSALPSPLPARVQKRLQTFEDTPRKETWNAIAILRGSAAHTSMTESESPSKEEVILLTAHLDHLGIARSDPDHPTADLIYNGADDDASGTAAVLTLAHLLATGPRPRRTVVFALFGSEELGGFGNHAFLAHPPVPLTSIVANLEFEMIGRPDPAVPPGFLWLTGFDRSDLGPALARHGAPLVNDPHPDQKFFIRSDNIALARQGIIAHTVSSFGLHRDYHHPSDDISTIDFDYLDHAVASMLPPIRWLASTHWHPQWNPDGRPAPSSPASSPEPAPNRNGSRPPKLTPKYSSVQ